MRPKERFYRDFTDTERWTAARVKVDSSDLLIRASRRSGDIVPAADKALRRIRGELWRHIEEVPDFLTSLSPLAVPPRCPETARRMYLAGKRAGVGPMAAVAGAVAEMVGRELAGITDEAIVENGGDIWMAVTRPVEASVYAGEHRFAGKIKLRITQDMTPCGICTSSATMGHSLSFGKADAVTVLAADAALADALATACCNRIGREENIPEALDFAMEHGAAGIIAVMRDSMGMKGTIELAG